MINGKVKNLDELAAILEKYRAENLKIVHCHGVFDLLHIGHIRYFEQACRMGDVLVVTVTPDEYVDKGPHRPAFDEKLRVEAVASLNCVSFAAVNKWPTAEETLRLLKPHVYVKGSEFKNIDSDKTGKISREAEVVAEIGSKLAFTEDIVFSSSNLINRYLSNLPDEINKYLELFRERHSLDEVMSYIDNMATYNTLVIGDAIIDDYQYCDAIGKSSKDPTLALKYQASDLFAGGALAVANHVANFSNNVTLISVIGEKDSHEQFIRSQLHPNIDVHLYVQPEAPTIVKRRYIDGYSFNKLFEIYIMDDSGLPVKKNEQLCELLRKLLPSYDVVIAADFGHGAISPEVIQTLTAHSRFLAVNTQANAGNRGFHTISKYPRANYASIAEHEMRLEVRDLNGNLRPKMNDLAKKLSCGRFVVTRGRDGCAICNGDGGFVQVPAFAQKAVDRVGAGDAFLAVTSLAAVQDNVPNELIGFLGNIVGALAVENIGNKKSIDKLSVEKYVMSLMK